MSDQAFPGNYADPVKNGMTLRDYFAAKAMQAAIADFSGMATHNNPEHFATFAYIVADAMMKQREFE